MSERQGTSYPEETVPVSKKPKNGDKIEPWLGCYDCDIEYGSPGFPDLLIPNWAWNKIAPHGPGIGTEGGGGVLCPNCICKRLEGAGIRNVPSAFVSGPLAYGPDHWMLIGEPR